MNLTISTYCCIKENKVWLNDQEIFKAIDDPEKDFLKQLYQHLKLDYPKFYKMDNISKLGLLAVEIMRQNNAALNNVEDDAVAMVFQTEFGCYESDLQHQQNIENRSASPAIFVYTLSNIVLGEISIRNKWFGESMCLIGQYNKLNDLVSYSKSLILTHKARIVIVGTIDSVDNNHKLNFFVVETESNGINFCVDNLKKIIEN